MGHKRSPLQKVSQKFCGQPKSQPPRYQYLDWSKGGRRPPYRAMTVTDHVGRRPLKRRIISSQEPDGRQSPCLLCARPERPRGCRADEQRDELAPFHSMTSLARVSKLGGISRPRAFAVVRLMTRSNLVGCSTGRSAG